MPNSLGQPNCVCGWAKVPKYVCLVTPIRWAMLAWHHKHLKNTIDLLLFSREHFYGFLESDLWKCQKKNSFRNKHSNSKLNFTKNCHVTWFSCRPLKISECSISLTNWVSTQKAKLHHCIYCMSICLRNLHQLHLLT